MGRSPAGPGQAAALTRPVRGSADRRSAAARDLARPLDVFGLALLQRQAQASAQGNVVVSPASLHAVLSMLLNGARGETAQQMRAALGLGSLPLARADQGWADLIALSQSGKKPEISLADSLWLRRGVAFRPAFLAADRDYFAAETHALPTDASGALDPDASATAINDWVAKRTAGRITDLVTPDLFDPRSTVLGLFNTVYLKVHWKHFDPAATHQESFTLANGQQVDVPMMHATELSTRVVQTDQYDAVSLSTDGPVTAWVVVPKGQTTADGLLARLDAPGLEALYRDARPATGALALPRFTTSFTAQQLSDELAAMGMPRAFSPEQAQFQGVADTGEQNLYISAVVQKTFLQLDEQGVEAAAASGAVVAGAAAPVEQFDVRADLPFLVVLTEKATHAPLFMGLIRDPRGSGT